MPEFFRVRSFERFQHYKNRNPPWIKLYGEILEKYEFCALPDASKAHLLAIWLLASRTNNRIPLDPTWVAGKIGARSPVDLEVLVQSGFIEVISIATNNGATCEQDASKVLCQRREETEQRRVEKETASRAAAPPVGNLVAQTPSAGTLELVPPPPLFLMRPDDYAKALFGPALEWLSGAISKPPDKLRSIMGLWLKDTGNDHERVFKLLADAELKQVADPRGWITAAIARTGATAAEYQRAEDELYRGLAK